jgi:ADP-ribose pyrophosphatase YjhB (NUDIX family)
LRVIAALGEKWSAENPYDVDRYHRVAKVGAQLFSLVDVRGPEEIEQTVFQELTHIAPIPVADAAVFDGTGRILLIQRSDTGRWAMPGGGLELGETPAEGACREAVEEAGVEVEPVALAGVYDSRQFRWHSLHLYMFVFVCRPTGRTFEPTTPAEVLDIGWFAEAELPPLSGGHAVRIPNAFAFKRGERGVHWDAASGPQPT